jgi:hypothetical protein
MKNRSSNSEPNSEKKYTWRTWLGVVSVTILIVGAVSAISREGAPMTLKAEVPGNVTSKNVGDNAAKASSKNYVTSNASGQTVVVDRETGQQRPLTASEAKVLAQGLAQLINQSTEGLVQVRHANGMVSMDLQGRFQNVLLAKREADGTVSQSCVDNIDSAAAFFEIDPDLIRAAAASSRQQQPISTTPEIR